MKKLNVYLKSSPEKKIFVGKLAEHQRQVYFQYNPGYLSHSLCLSPYKLPLQPDVFEHKDRDFAPVFGLFDDSLPDGWGVLLMNRYLSGRGIDIDTLSVLDRLSFLGDATMGALVYEPAFEHEDYDQTIDLQLLADQSGQILDGEDITILPKLARAGGSPQGARPKVLVGVKENRLIFGALDLPEGYEHWLIKFPAKDELADSGRIEFVYSIMAGDAGLDIPETKLFEVGDEHAYFGIKRFDRSHNNRLHLHSLGGLIHSNFRLPQLDYRFFIKVVSDLTKNQQDVERGFRQMVFNIITNNRDDHVKNFAFLMNQHGEWRLSPSYDLTYSPGPGGEHSMSIAGEGRSPQLKHIRQIGSIAGLGSAKIKDITEQVVNVAENWKEYASRWNIVESGKDLIQGKIKQNIDNLMHTPSTSAKSITLGEIEPGLR